MEKTTKSKATLVRTQLQKQLAEPFAQTEVKFKPAVVSGNRALALAYVDARVVQDRLDEVLGVDGWQDSYRCLEDGSVVCRLRLRLAGRWVTKVDVGSPSEQGDAGDRRKAAFSDALKRAAVKFGIGRYLYRFPSQWVDYDSGRKRFAQTPKIPAFALPKSTAAKHAASTPTKLPKDGTELQRRLTDKDAALAKAGKCKSGELIKFVIDEGIKSGYAGELHAWSGPAIQLAVQSTRQFERGLPAEERREVA